MNIYQKITEYRDIKILRMPAIILAAVFFTCMSMTDLYAFNRNLVFDGVDDYADLTTEGTVDVGYNSGLSFTVDLWVYPTDYGCMISDDAYDIGYKDVDGSNVICFEIWAGDFSVEMYMYVDIFDGWHHVFCMFDNLNNRAAIGVDGEIDWFEDIDDDDGLYNGDWPLVIGAYTSNDGFFPGKIDEVRISDSLRYSGDTYTVPTLPFTDDLNTLALWHFDEEPGSTSFSDSSGAGNTLTGYNGCTTEGIMDDTSDDTVDDTTEGDENIDDDSGNNDDDDDDGGGCFISTSIYDLSN